MPNSPWNIKTDSLTVTDDSGRITYLTRENILFLSSSSPPTLSIGTLNVVTSSIAVSVSTTSSLPTAASSVGYAIKCINLLTSSLLINAFSGNLIDGNVSGSYLLPSGDNAVFLCFDSNSWKSFSDPPLVAGSNIAITTGSNGQVTISSTAATSWPGSASQLVAGDGTTVNIGSGLSLAGGTLTNTGGSGGGTIYIAQSRNSTVFPHTTFVTAGMTQTSVSTTGTKTFYAVMTAPSGYTIETRLTDITAGGNSLVSLMTTSTSPTTVSGTFSPADNSRRIYAVETRISGGSPTVNDIGFLYGTSIEIT